MHAPKNARGSAPAQPLPAGRVTVVANDVYEAGGQERQLMRLITGLLRRGWHVTVLARRCDVPPHELLAFVRVPLPTRPFTLAYPAFFVAASIVLAIKRSGIVHATGAIVANRVDVTTVHFCHHGFAARYDARRMRKANALYGLNATLAARMRLLAERWVYRPARARRVIPVSHGVGSEVLEFFPKLAGCVQVIPNGVDSHIFRPDEGARSAVRAQLGLHDSALVAVFLGGEWERKGLPLAAQALETAREWHLLVLGSGDAERLERSVSEDARRRLHLTGPVPDPERYLAAGDAFVFPTSYEAFPLSVLEAASSGLPLVATQVSGIEDILQDGVNGIVVEREPASIARALQALTDKKLRIRMGAAARESVLAFDWDRVVDQYAELYRDLSASAQI